ncbi:RNA polymerase sigma factor SigJ [Nocardia speluncae]|uniref:RNA polymerase sigma factor SigJ n=1 Tax=Nocardia speluncae TaxID=419477 RepID=A0A846XDE2_9NOCA|nr:RNA polymerase sigma factor SigJ [Nocardia speluncae]NKY33417.1 RNA polymerase sigma factor SigJ [Nocardia speluncae]
MPIPFRPPDERPDPNLDVLLGERTQLIGLAYRLLGSLADAEDVVQEAFARWYAMSEQQRGVIRSPGAWLQTVASRICFDLLGSARARREHYVGEWLPEPVPESAEWITGRSDNPADRITLDESVSMAFLVVLDTMTPAERVAFTLHDVFGYSFADIAEIVGRTPAACRQLASSARRRIRAARTPEPRTGRPADIVGNFKRAWAAKDIEALIGLLDPDAVAIADSGGIVNAALGPLEGADRIARYYVMLASCAPGNLDIVERTVNGRPGLVVQHNGVAATVLAFDLTGDRITRIWAMRNPDKLRSWTEDRHPPR